jgi:hypothetical protein
MSKSTDPPQEYDPDAWKPRPGNYYLTEGTWIYDRHCDRRGVVAGFPGVHEGGTVKIIWYTDRTEYVSARSMRWKLIDRRYEFDRSQHPYNKLDWVDHA